MALTVLSVLENFSVLALSLLTNASLLASPTLYKPQHQPHDLCRSGWQRWRSACVESRCFINSAIPIPNPKQQISGFQVSGVRCQESAELSMGHGDKSEIRISKFETNSKSEFTNVQNRYYKRNIEIFGFWSL